MSTVVAQSLHVFGFRSHVANNVFFFDEQIIIFPSGNHCVKYNVDQKWQKFIPGKTLSSLTYHQSTLHQKAVAGGGHASARASPPFAVILLPKFLLA
uniref:Uncharacterized protein n=1 Tax=Sus scrofa TaxID=9823 RepID=A0A8D2BG22_PIG